MSEAVDQAKVRKSLETWDSPAKYRTLLECIDEGFCVIQVLFDAQGAAVDYLFVETNRAFDQQTGLKDAVGRTMRSFAPEHEEHWFRIYGEVAKTGAPVRFEAPAVALGRHYDVNAFRVGRPEQNLVAVLFNDVTQRMELAQAIEDNNRSLREADRRKDQFLATLSHELRNPLAPLKVAADLLGRSGLGDDQMARTREIIRRQVGHMSRLLEDLLDVGRITQGKLVLQRQNVRPTELIDSAVESVRPLFERKQHVLDVQLTPDAPMLDVDPVRISQVVANLLGNAAKYTDAGGHVTLCTRREDECFVIEVRDNGIGIPREALQRVFEMLSQVHETSHRAEGGLGIGLALVKGLVELHGGSVRAESAGPGRGSVFTVRLPISSRDAELESAAPVASTAPGRCKVLIADDNRDAAESMAMLLDHLGHDVRVAFDGPTALSMARTFRPDLAFLDIGMPKLDGYGVARALRKEPWAASLTLVAATGWGDAEARRMSADSGFDRHLTKPVGPDEVQSLLQQVTKRLGPRSRPRSR